MDAINVGLLGLGTVGGGVYKIIQNHQDQLRKKCGSSINISKVLVQNQQKERTVSVNAEQLTTNANDILQNPEIDVVVEVMGGTDDAYHHILEAFRHHKHVITANKDLIALHGSDLLREAKRYNCDLYFEASVGGGIPVLRGLVDGLASDRIHKMIGIVNGTTNYILSKMARSTANFETILKDAQDKGFAEADPTSDIGGFDAARKMIILSALGYGMNINLDDVHIEGISGITQSDIAFGKRLGYVVKLIGIAHMDNDGLEVSVQPTLLSTRHPLASVQDEYNAIYIYGDAVGETMFYGPGAGELPTATAIVSDLVTTIKNIRLGICGQNVTTPNQKKRLKPSNKIYSQQYIRLHVKDQAGAFSKITQLFEEQNVSLAKIIQEPLHDQNTAEVVAVTHKIDQQTANDLTSRLNDLDVVESVKNRLRVEGLV